MNRTQLITLLLVLFAGIGVASAKPKVAVLGVEVLDKTNVKPSVDAARQITEGLRAAAAAAGPYDIAPNSQREFLDEKIINQCEAEQRECLLKMANNFGAAALVYGKLQLADNKKNYQITIFLLSGDKNAAKPAITAVPVTASNADLVNAGKKIYNELVGNTGTIMVRVDASGRGQVFINNELNGQLVGGEHRATAVTEGEHKVRIQVDGFKKWEDTVRVKAGQITNVEPKLQADAVAKVPTVQEDPEDKGSRPVKGGDDPYKLETRENTISKGGGGRTVWKAVAIGGAAVAVGSGVFMILENSKIGDAEKAADTATSGTDLSVTKIGRFDFFPDCSEDASGIAASDMPMNKALDGRKAYADGCKASRNTKYAGVGLGVGLGVAILGAYMGFIRGEEASESPPQTGSTKRPRKQRFAVTPIVSPDGGGATMRIDF
jgi:PEGA domain